MGLDCGYSDKHPCKACQIQLLEQGIHLCTSNIAHKRDKEWECKHEHLDCKKKGIVVMQCLPCIAKANAQLTARRIRAGYKAKPPAKKVIKKRKATKKKLTRRSGKGRKNGRRKRGK
jgi:hypothetical protein